MKLATHALSLAILGTVFYLSACSDGGTTHKNAEARADSADSKKTAEEHNNAKFDKVGEKDAKYVVDAYEAGLFEIRMADTAKEYATTKEGKSLAEMMYTGHAKLNEELRNLAKKKQISLPDDVTSAQSDKLKNIRSERRINFDKKYASAMVDGHKDAINLFEKASKECTDGDLANWFSAALPDLRKHLDAAMNAEEEIKKMKR
ncbi:MAG: hypothetical protein C5B52_12700 [Bacteroidetes bacterium]|nr:MAG: hypothetical protein C5B52_12700 [Bacteroidota bacterium]